MKHPALGGPDAVDDDVACAADGGLIRYFTVPKAFEVLLPVPPPGVCCGCAWVCVDVDATVVGVPLPVPEVDISDLTGVAESSAVGGFMAISQSVCYDVPFAIIPCRDCLCPFVCSKADPFRSFEGLLVRLLIEGRSGGVLGALRTDGSSRKPAFCVRFPMSPGRFGLA